jgi:hypothetical protein
VEAAGCEEVGEEHVEVDVAVAAAVVVQGMVVVGVQAVFGLDHDIGCEVDLQGHEGWTKPKVGDLDRMDDTLLLHDHHKRMVLRGPHQALYSHPSRHHLEFAPAPVGVEAE